LPRRAHGIVAGMKKRVAATVLWALVGWTGGSLVMGIFGAPPILALVPALLMPAFVLWDPNGALWGRSVTGKRIVRPINEFAESLSKNAPSGVIAEQRLPR
jgi:hypothetical protein